MAGETRPMLDVFEDVEHVSLRHACLQLLLELGEPRWLLRLRELLEVRGAVGIDAEFGIVRETGVNLGRQGCELVLQRRGEILAPRGNADGGAVGRQPRLALQPWQELRAVVREAFRALDIEIARLQRAGEVDEHAHLQRAPVVGVGSGPTLGDEMLPTLGGEAQVDAVQLQGIAAGVAMFAH